MTLKQDGLTDIGMGPGNTTNFAVWYEDSLPNQAGVKAAANALLAVVEAEFTVTTGWFNTPSGRFGTGNRQQVHLDRGAGGGGSNSGYGSAMSIDSLGAGGSPQESVKMVWMNEWVEILMSLTSNWNRGDSSGEGLSQYCGIVRFQVGHYSYYGSWVDSWLNGVGTSPNAARSDWVTQTFSNDGDSVSFGCALAFIYYLNVQLGFSINQIIAAYSSNLRAAYNTLTGDSGNPFPFFLNLIASVYPAAATAAIPGPVSDDPFPIALVSFADSKNTFGVDEASDIINSQGGLVSGAFWVMVDGFSKRSFNSLGITAANNFSGDFFTLPGVAISPNGLGTQFQAGVNDTTPSRVGVPFDITLSDPFPTQTPGTYTLSVQLTSSGNAVSGGSASTQFELLVGADPYFSNIDVNQDNQAYLSQDLRVFTATPAQNPVPIPGGPSLADSISGAYQYIRDLLNHLNGSSSFTNPSGTDAFATFPDQAGTNQTDSSVTPFTLDLSTFPTITLDKNYNFAVARVRLQGSSGPSGAASNVRVFFRLFSTQTNDTDYDINSTYRSNPDASGKPGSPLVGSDNTTIPMFATGNFSSSTDYDSGGPNIHDMVIPDHQHAVYRYYGCFLNVYDSNNIINGQPVQALLNGTHHCLVAQIAYDDAPVPQGASPLAWDQLAQRNLQVTLSDNPGPPAAHRIPQTFDCRPSASVVPPGGALTPVPPDELMIDWGSIPTGSVASLYWPQVSAAEVVSLADQFYASNPLTASEAHTVQLKVTKGLSYVPIPSGAGQNFAGLFTVDLPPSKVSKGQTFDIVVRRLSSKTYTPPPPIKTPRATHTLPADFTAERAVITRPSRKHPPSGSLDGSYTWRYMVGAFKVQIPVTTADKILPLEENTLAIMKWRLQEMMPSNRWHPVLTQYVSYISDRVAGLGGNPNAIPPSLSGAPIAVIGHQERKSYTGKVCEVIYDCFGDFDGFVLETCGARHSFKSCERGIGEIALRACRERLRITVVVEAGSNSRIQEIVVRC
jgi:hypothetical protein